MGDPVRRRAFSPPCVPYVRIDAERDGVKLVFDADAIFASHGRIGRGRW